MWMLQEHIQNKEEDPRKSLMTESSWTTSNNAIEEQDIDCIYYNYSNSFKAD